MKRVLFIFTLIQLNTIVFFAQDKIGNFIIKDGKLNASYSNDFITKLQIDDINGGFGTGGIVENHAGDLHLRGYWGVVIDKNGGNLGESTSYFNGVNPTGGCFAVRTRMSTSSFRTDFIIRNNGKIGIGTSDPGSLVDVVGDGSDVAMKIRHKNESNTSWGLTFGQKEDLKGFIVSSGRDLQISCGWNKSLILGQEEFNNSNGKIIFPGGNVGIGTTSPSHKLEVAGTIRAEEIKVESGWADFVFHPSYTLRPLQEVNTYIQQNGHLPEIPTAKEVEENGVSLGEMNAKLLQKIEELTLYTIEQEKTINKLLENNEKLTERVESLENKK